MGKADLCLLVIENPLVNESEIVICSDWYRWTSQCWEEHTLQYLDENGHPSRELPFLHHRAQQRTSLLVSAHFLHDQLIILTSVAFKGLIAYESTRLVLVQVCVTLALFPTGSSQRS